ncbi:MAG: radical SAM protein [Candidatus Hodarchaeota archaeon]
MIYNVLLSSLNVGCRPSCVQSGQIYHYLLSNNHRIVNDESKADFIILNTCGFINWFEESSELVIKYFISLKKKVKLIVIGCLTKINRDRIAKYDDVIIIDNLKDLDKYFFTLERFQQKNIFFNDKVFTYLNSGMKVRRIATFNAYVSFLKIISHFLTRLNLSPFPFNKIAERHLGEGNFFVKIGEGCMGNCSYCAIKIAKKSIISRPIEEILLDIKKHIEEQKEKNIILIADDCGSYGIDIGTNIIELLFQIGKVFPSIGIGIYYLYPKWIEKFGKELLNVFRKVKIDNINIPIQSGSQKILTLMNRKYNLEKIFHFIKKLKKISPNTMVYTHYLFGFPGERFKDFLKTLSTTRYFHYYFPLMYSSRKGTRSSELPETVSKFMKNVEICIAIALLYIKFVGFFIGNIIRSKKL